MFEISKWFFGTRYLITLTIVLIILWLIIFSWFLIEEKKYKDEVVDKSSFARTYYEIKENTNLKKKYYGNAFSDSIYFISTMFGTFGYGDIYPRTNTAKLLVSCMHFIVIIFGMNLYENIFVSNKTIKNLSMDVMKLSDQLNTTKEKLKRSNSKYSENDPLLSNLYTTD
jgi:hypothetical protein